MRPSYYKKYIRIPPGVSIDIREILHIINHPLFQRLLYVGQLGTTLSVFPGATHNRFEHALGVYHKTKNFCQRLVTEYILSHKEALNVSLFALLHDIGHGPFSHVIEELTPYDHDKNGARIIKELKSVIIKSGGDFNFVQSLFERKNNLYRIVMDRNIGTDKLDYLERDTYHTGFGQRPDVETILDYSSFIDGHMVIDKKSLEAAKQIQRLYIYMFKEVYLHKSTLISQRFFQKMLARLIHKEKIKSADLWAMNDHQIMARIYMNNDPTLKFLYQAYIQRNLPRTGLVIRLKNRKYKERIAGKSIKLIGEDIIFFQKFTKKDSPAQLERLESIIAKEIGVESFQIVIVPILNPWRFEPQDILYHDDGEVLSLKETHIEYFESMKGELEDYLAIRVCIIGDREKICISSEKILKLLKKFIA